jgi:hypothetical protein
MPEHLVLICKEPWFDSRMLACYRRALRPYVCISEAIG